MIRVESNMAQSVECHLHLQAHHNNNKESATVANMALKLKASKSLENRLNAILDVTNNS